ncbi:hypothetical protein N7492_005657 [Penicillium capsulatum]|uniref:Uncharacterized protein n=1 Tax=Penicillium capsulatum TaxID=69766 RepID=A0A9W9LR83_9EURO|nr:hypothetical protein N7492_005657 [Penicillium capsulatum]
MEESLKDTIKTQADALALMEKYEKNQGLSSFGKYRTRQTFIALQGDQWKEDNPKADEKDRPADEKIVEKHWKNFKSKT